MEYTIQKLAQLAGISTRTLRYYDEIELLKPARINSSGYRIYGTKEVDQLQQMMFYRELGINLEQIKEIINSPSFNQVEALKEHYAKLLEKRKRINTLITNVEKTIAATEGGTKMNDQEKFEGFKQKMITDNERKYGEEIRDKYGENTIDRANEKLKNMTQEQHEEVTQLAKTILSTLADAYQTGDPASEFAQKVAAMHKQWLMYYWPEYSKDAHVGLAQMYVDDERFKAYYDAVEKGAAEFLRDAILIYLGKSPMAE